MKKILVSPFLFLICSPLFGIGGTSSGGGNSFNNQHNPWFLENTKTIKYCLDIDELSMGTSKEFALNSINKAISYWKNEFKNSFSPIHLELEPFTALRIATQNFKYEECKDSTDLKFQLGKLSTAQKNLIKNPRNYIGIALRDSYDTKNLKAKGFIYISPAFGPLRPISKDFAKEPWSACDGCILEIVLKHELGHVFGLRHESFETLNLMNDTIPALLTSKEAVSSSNFPKGRKGLEQLSKTPYFIFSTKILFKSNINLVFSGPRDFKKILGVTEDEEFIKISKVGDNVYHVYASKDTNNWEAISKMCEHEAMTTHGKPKILLYLDFDQKVFSKYPKTRFIIGHYQESKLTYSATFCSLRGLEKTQLMVTAQNHGTSYLGGYFEEKIYPSIVVGQHESPQFKDFSRITK